MYLFNELNENIENLKKMKEEKKINMMVPKNIFFFFELNKIKFFHVGGKQQSFSVLIEERERREKYTKNRSNDGSNGN